MAEKQYMEAFNDELNSFKDRVRTRAKVRLDEAMEQVEEVGSTSSAKLVNSYITPLLPLFNYYNPQLKFVLLQVCCNFVPRHIL